jgi:hypothetical protein
VVSWGGGGTFSESSSISSSMKSDMPKRPKLLPPSLGARWVGPCSIAATGLKGMDDGHPSNLSIDISPSSSLGNDSSEVVLEVLVTLETVFCASADFLSLVMMETFGVSCVVEVEKHTKGWLKFRFLPSSSMKGSSSVFSETKSLRAGEGSDRKGSSCSTGSPFSREVECFSNNDRTGGLEIDGPNRPPEPCFRVDSDCMDFVGESDRLGSRDFDGEGTILCAGEPYSTDDFSGWFEVDISKFAPSPMFFLTIDRIGRIGVRDNFGELGDESSSSIAGSWESVTNRVGRLTFRGDSAGNFGEVKAESSSSIAGSSESLKNWIGRIALWGERVGSCSRNLPVDGS